MKRLPIDWENILAIHAKMGVNIQNTYKLIKLKVRKQYNLKMGRGSK